MKTRILRFVSISALLAVLAAAVPAHAATDLGQVDFPTSASPEAQAHFLRGVAALHSFWYDEAADAFRAAQKAEPGFALAYWGEAMTYNHPIWSEQDAEAARAVLNRLAPNREAQLAKAPTEREKAFLDAVEILYGEGDKKARDTAYAAAMRRIHERWPDDLEAASFYALSLIGPALTGPPGEERHRTLIQAAALLEEQFVRNPQHPGVLHYLIHAYDDPLHAPLGLRAARTYAKVAPAAHHALHMPSHIFVQLGDWQSTAASNEAAWAASVDWVKRRGLAIDKEDFHSLSWLGYAYLQQGRYGKAREALETVRQAARQSDSPRIAAAVQGMEARYAVETRSWHTADFKAAAAGKGEGGACHGAGASHGQAEGARLLALALAAARHGDPAAAEEAASRLSALSSQGGDGYREGATGVMQKEAAAMAALAKKDAETALKLLAEAAELEAHMGPPSGPPEPIKPAQELYGELLMEQGKAKEAAEQFAQALLRMPNRAALLLGAARAAVKLGDGDAARRSYGRLAEIWRQADPDSPELAEVRGYLEGAVASGRR
ncbi:MAG TPA: tetratricopeptide repeat protein [Thermoanaerobaculia bacterium]|jgi:tetratricopeptide (TPR) repeat protein|nr:tetratricopeptide repeat protein [Thermoanaerobaculia bacterium]